jgi:uncharacterized membrane protein
MLGLVVALALVPLVVRLDLHFGWTSSADPNAARDVLGTLASSMFTCIIFVASALLLAVQLASAQLTPRIIGLVFKDPVPKLALSVFVFTFTFSLAVLLRIGTSVPPLATRLAAYSCLASLGLFLFLIDYVAMFLRPSGALRAVALVGHRVIATVFPRRLTEAPASSPEREPPLDGEAARTIASESSGVILAFDITGLTSLASRFDCVIVVLPQVGDFVAAGEPLFRVLGGGVVPARDLHRSLAVGAERTFEQDPAFAFRIMVDVASKALSPAINDPTTAVLALDQIHSLLRDAGQRRLDEGQVRDASGRLRLAFRTPDWEDFVRLAVTEIRQFGGESIQVVRRMRAMLENLIQTLPEARTSLLRQELKLLQRSAKRSFSDPEDQALAGISDTQGVGGKRAEGPDESAGPAVNSGGSIR